jgi:hypothetical protein
MMTEPTPLMRAVAGANCAGSGAYRQRGADGALRFSAASAPGYAGGWVESVSATPNPIQSTRAA